MRSTHFRFRSLISTVTGLLLLAACSDALVPEVIEETNFASTLDVDLASMTRTPSGLYFETLDEGTGDPVVEGDAVTVSFVGWLSNGTTFDFGEIVFTLGLGQVLTGFEEGVLGMKLGGVRRVIVPPSLGYGNTARGSIPPGSILVFHVEVDDIR